MALRNAFGDLSLEATQQDVLAALAALLAELQTKLDAGGTVALDGATLAALEAITSTVANFPSDYPDAAVLVKNEEVRALLASVLADLELKADLTETQPVSLPGAQVADLKAVTATIGNWLADYPDAAVLAKNEQIRALIDALNTKVQSSVTADQGTPGSSAWPIIDTLVTPFDFEVSAAVADQVVVTPSPGMRLRVVGFQLHMDPAAALGTYNIVHLGLVGAGPNDRIFRDKFEPGLPYAESKVYEGDVDAPLTITTSDASTIYGNVRTQEFAP